MPYDRLRYGRVSSSGQTYLITTVTAERIPIFDNMLYGRIAVNALRELDNAGATRSLAFVVMPDHVHWLFELQATRSLGNVLNLFKGRTARRLNARRNSHAVLWQPAYHDRAVRSDESLIDMARYVIMNPVRAGLVTQIGDYPLWDSIWMTPSDSPFPL